MNPTDLQLAPDCDDHAARLRAYRRIALALGAHVDVHNPGHMTMGPLRRASELRLAQTPNGAVGWARPQRDVR